MQKSCGNCKFWIKLHSIKGLCDLNDYGWANSDSGSNCIDWKRKRDIKPRTKLKLNEIDICQYTN